MLRSDRDRRHRARYDAVRRDVFAEMDRQSTRWRVAWFVPFNLFVFGLLWLRGESWTRVALQLGTLAGGLVVATVFHRRRRVATGHAPLGPFYVGAIHYFVGLAVTGSIASPLLPVGLPIAVISAIVLEERRAKVVFSLFLVAGFSTLALISRTPWGSLAAPLSEVNGTTSLEYVIVATCSVVFAVVSLLRIGLYATDVYAEVALELAARREEIFEDGEDRSRSFEGVAARLAHEVKNPLAAIKGLSLHLARNSHDAKVEERLSIVAQEADRLQGIVDGFLGFSRGLDDLKLVPTKPYAIARELLLLLETRAAESNVTLEVIGDESAEIIADGRKLRQALLNLVLNAVQASPPNTKVTMHVARTKQGTLRMRVIDRGAGMSPEVLDRIRKPGFTTRAQGTGLGVAMARALIEQHGGSISYESTEGSGTTVTVELPPNASLAAGRTPLPLIDPPGPPSAP
ncbi:MAG TPA: HAMP domain-containing sensor histidine kinase [Polyangiaceae bacterium]